MENMTENNQLNQEVWQKAQALANRHYQVEVEYSEEDEAFLARNPEFSGCISDGQTEAEAIKNLHSARISYIYALILWDDEILEPREQV